MRLSNDVLKLVNKLPEAKRNKVAQIVRRHLIACQKNDCPPESLDRVYLEAIEVAEMELRNPEPEKPEFRTWEPARRYDQYVSPKAA